ncbi:hypothetical protein CP967_32440 [Streptomyces nitrosporeus]|uniref:Uncharacterized protein n=1 Tax=Streptomyces nitrosporeus TaxID=28894 RepID=A0A5J6FL51_9ACTN|nr:hypothetical protein CP967_32440 [Streptomyces nitrosporeus]GGZ07490.1 hypothetical protein GCM10010327_42400 [Streptomyces nitrosporeus]
MNTPSRVTGDEVRGAGSAGRGDGTGPAGRDGPDGHADLAGPSFRRLPRAKRLAAFARLRQLVAPVRSMPRTGSQPPFHALVRHGT